MTRRRLVAGNWKMNGTSAELGRGDARFRSPRESYSGVDVALCLPATLDRARRRCGRRGSRSAGRMSTRPRAGAHTGCISAAMLVDAGAVLTIVGHSERRDEQGESDADGQGQGRSGAWPAGLKVILCVGESDAVRSAGKRLAMFRRSSMPRLPGQIGDPAAFSVAYEPIWAIGTGKVAGVAEIGEMHAALRARLVAAYGEAGRACGSSMAGRSRPTMPPRFSPWPMSMAPWSAGRASSWPTSCRSSRGRSKGCVETTRRSPLDAPQPFPESTLMFTFLLIVQTIVAASLVLVILMQRSEGGGLGVGGSVVGVHDRARRGRFPDPRDGDSRRRVHRPVDRACGDRRRRPASRPRSTPRWRKRAAPVTPAPATAPAAPRAPGGAARAISPRRPIPAEPAIPLGQFFDIILIRVLASGRGLSLRLDSHGAVYFHHRRRGLLAWQRFARGVPRGAAPGARLFGPDPQVRSLSQRRSGDDVALSARRGVRHRRRRRDRPRSGPLRALHRRVGAAERQCHHRPHLPGHHRPRTARRLSWRDGPGRSPRHQRDQGIRAGRYRRARLRHLRDRRDRRRHREPAVRRGDPPAAGTTLAAASRCSSTPPWCPISPPRAN